MASLATKTCPECGYAITEEDEALQARRDFYLEAFRWERWVGIVVLVVGAVPCAMGVLGEEVGVLALATCAVVVSLAQFGGLLVSRGLPKLHRRVFRWAWWMGVLYWTFVWMAAACGVLLAVAWSEDWSYWRFSRSRIQTLVFSIVGIASASGLTIPLWRLFWLRTSRLAGVPEAHRTRGKFRRGILAAAVVLAPISVLVLLGLVAGAIIGLLDRFFPTWYMD